VGKTIINIPQSSPFFRWYPKWVVYYIVGGFNPSEKYKSVGMTTPNIWKVIKFMFQTTNQLYIYIFTHEKQGIIYPSTTHHFSCYIRLLLMAIVLPTSNCRHISESPWDLLLSVHG